MFSYFAQIRVQATYKIFLRKESGCKTKNLPYSQITVVPSVASELKKTVSRKFGIVFLAQKYFDLLFYIYILSASSVLRFLSSLPLQFSTPLVLRLFSSPPLQFSASSIIRIFSPPPLQPSASFVLLLYGNPPL